MLQVNRKQHDWNSLCIFPSVIVQIYTACTSVNVYAANVPLLVMMFHRGIVAIAYLKDCDNL